MNATNRPSTHAVFIALICATHAALAQEPPALPDHVKVLEVATPGSDRPIEPVDHKLYSYSDSARVIADGAIWAWGTGGRPLAMAKAWKNRNGTQTCAFS